jgi:predicted dehydrogenase
VTLRFGLVGAGFIGGLYRHSLKQVAGAEIVAVASPNRAQAFAERHHIAAHYADYRAMIADAEIDAVLIAAPNNLHADICIAAAEAGKHVFCDKPLAMSLAEADAMIAACEGAGVVLMYGENLLFAPMYERLRDLVRAGNIGQPFLVRQSQCHGGPYSPWFWDIERAGGGVLLDMGCHSIRSICHTFGAWPEAVTATLGRYLHTEKTLAEDHATVLLHYPGGALGIAENSWAMPGGEDRLAAYGPTGRLEANLERGPAIAMYTAPTKEAPAAGGWQYPSYDEARQFGFPQELQHFVDVIAGRTEPRSTGADGRRVLEIICAAYESARLNRRVALPFESTKAKPIEHWLGE